MIYINQQNTSTEEELRAKYERRDSSCFTNKTNFTFMTPAPPLRKPQERSSNTKTPCSPSPLSRKPHSGSPLLYTTKSSLCQSGPRSQLPTDLNPEAALRSHFTYEQRAKHQLLMKLPSFDHCTEELLPQN